MCLVLAFACYCTGFAQNIVDTTIGLDIKAGKDYRQTAQKLCSKPDRQRLKANALFNWITHNIQYRVPAIDNISLVQASADDIYQRRWGTAADIAVLLSAMCREAGIIATDIEGYTREWFYDSGDVLMLPRHTWNALYIDDKWELVDAAFGAGYTALYLAPPKKDKNILDEAYTDSKERYWNKYNSCFMPDVREFRITHLPSDPMWQLTEHKMSIETFEKGIDAIKRYNTKYLFDLKRNDEHLLRMAQMNTDERIDDNADRRYKYNANDITILALKETAEANALLTLYNRRDNRKYAYREMLDLAKQKFTKAFNLHKDQYKLFKPYYGELIAKSTVKNKDALNNLKLLKQIGKLNKTKCESYKNISATNASAFDGRSKTMRDIVAIINPDSIPGTKQYDISRTGAETEHKRLIDSSNARLSKINKLLNDSKKTEFEVVGRASENYERLQQWVSQLETADSFLHLELSLRKKMYDNNDSELIRCMNTFKESRYGKSDTLLKYQLLAYDTINKIQAVVLNNYAEIMRLYKLSKKEIEQFARMYGIDSAITQTYKDVLSQYKYTANDYCDILNSYSSFENNNALLYARITDMYDGETKTLNEAELAENLRNATEKYDITDHRTYNEEKSLRYQAYVQNMIKEVDKLILIEAKNESLLK